MLTKFFISFLLLMPALSMAQTTYVVQSGDTLLKIADRTLGAKDKKLPRRYQVANEIKKLNPDLKNPNELEPGQTLLILGPTKTAKPTPPPPLVEPEHTSDPTPVAPVAEKIEPSPVDPKPIVEAHPPQEVQTHAAEPATPHAEAVHESAHHDFFFVQPRYQMLEIKTKDVATKTKVSMKSKSSFGLDLQYGKILNDHWHLLFQAGATQTQFDKIEGEGATVNHTSETLKYFALGIAYEAASTLHLDLMLMSSERTYLLPAILPDYELKAIAVPAAELNISWDFYSGASNILGISAVGEYLIKVEKDSVEYKAAMETFGSLYWKSKYGHDSVNYKVTLTYKHGHQETTLSEQNEDVSSLGVGFYF